MWNWATPSPSCQVLSKFYEKSLARGLQEKENGFLENVEIRPKLKIKLPSIKTTSVYMVDNDEAILIMIKLNDKVEQRMQINVFLDNIGMSNIMNNHETYLELIFVSEMR